jgi:heme-degrading monooxygenase HmoA
MSRRTVLSSTMTAVLVLAACGPVFPGTPASLDPSREEAFRRAAGNGARVEEVFRRTRRLLHAWLAYADGRTLLLPDVLPGYQRGPKGLHVYRPHNSGADNYPYLVATAWFTDRALYDGRLREMLRNEIRYTNVLGGIPADLDLETGKLGPPSLFGAAEYAKDGLIAITELLGRTPWFHRMADMTADLMEHAPVASDFGALPDPGAELNGDALQTLVRLAPMTGERRFLEWAERIGDAYVREVLPRNHGLPGYTWDFAKHEGPDRMRLRDHGNEMVVGLALLEALESERGGDRAQSYRTPIGTMLDRVLASANPDGLLYDEIRPSDLAPVTEHLSDNWGYVYGAVYTHFMITGDERYREAVRRVLRSLPRYRGHDWESGSQDGYADSIESALYLVAREPVPEALDWIETETARLVAFQKEDGTVERWYGDGNWARTLLLYALMKTQGSFLDGWQEGVRLGAVREGERLLVSLEAPPAWKGRLRFDHARHRRDLNFARDYVRLNEWPEWFTVDENTLYRLTDGSGQEIVRLGSELETGIEVQGSGRWVLEVIPRTTD